MQIKDKEWEAQIHHLGRRLRRKGLTPSSLERLERDVRKAQRELEQYIGNVQKELWGRLKDVERPCFWSEQQTYRFRLEGLGLQQRQLDALHVRVRRKEPDQQDLAGEWNLTE